MKRFKYALQGMQALFGKDLHFKVHCLIALMVIMLGLLFELNTVEWLFIISAIFFVLVTEAINTSIEFTVDLISDDYHELAKHAKDTSAFAVLIASVYAVIAGLVIFLPKIIDLFT